jgi:signal transduction histidine kinase/ligand-binding sensor domain-containing protein
VDDGLSSSSVISALQDYKGFMWFGTYSGLNRYDGANFVNYISKNDKSDDKGITSNYCKALLEDHDKILLVGTGDDLLRYDRDNDRFVSYMTEKSSALFGLKFLVNQIVEDSIGNLWLATDHGAVYFDRNNNTYIQYRHDANAPTSISSDFTGSVCIDSRKRVWIVTASGLNLFKPQSGTFERITRCKTHPFEKIGDIGFLSIAEDHDGDVWFGSDNGLFCLGRESDLDSITLTHYTNDPRDPHSISKCRVKSLFVDNDGRLLIGAENEGLNIYDKQNNHFIHYRIDEFNPMSLNNESINGFIQDRDENLWVCTHKGGVNLLIKNNNFIIHYKNIPGAPQSLSYNIVSAFLEDCHKRVWVGTDGGGFNLFNDTTNRFTRFYFANPSLNRNSILCIAEQSEHKLWMGTWEGGLLSFDYTTNSFKAFTRQNSGIADNCIYSIAIDTSGNLWMGSWRNGLIYYNTHADTFTNFSPDNSTIADVRISMVKINSRGQLYLGSNKGFQIYTPIANTFTTFINRSDDSSGISSNFIYDILIQNDTCVWIATTNGLNRFNPVNENFYKLFVKDGLPDNTIKGMALDTFGVVWLSTNNGICRYDPQLNRFKSFTTSDGLQSNEFFEASMYTTREGSIWAGGINGCNLIHPDKYSDNVSVPPIVLTDFYLFNERVKIGAKGSPLYKQISETSRLTLSYQQSVLTFFFSALDFANPKKNQYAYKMENFDKEWIYCGNRKDATYTNLNPGKYRFRVKGSNNDGRWNETGTTLEIVITPPWWKTKTARIGFAISIICLFMGIFFYRINTLHKQKAILEKLVQKRTHEIEEQNTRLNQQNILLEQRQKYIDEQTKELSSSNKKLMSLNATKDRLFTIIAHDLKNPFASILGYCEILSRRFENMTDTNRKKSIRIIYESSKRVFTLLENLLHWARSQTGTIKYEPEEFVLDEVISVNIALIEEMALEKKIDIKKLNTLTAKVFADKNMIDTVIRNLITNAIKFTEAGYVGIETCQDKDFVTIKIVDTGVGINSNTTNSIFDDAGSKSTFGTRGESGTGLGLVICREFAEKNGGSIKVESELGKGSTFSFTIPTHPLQMVGNAD